MATTIVMLLFLTPLIVFLVLGGLYLLTTVQAIQADESGSHMPDGW